MSNELEIRERQKNHLGSVLRIKRAMRNNNADDVIKVEIQNALLGMQEEDIAVVEKIIDEKAL